MAKERKERRIIKKDKEKNRKKDETRYIYETTKAVVSECDVKDLTTRKKLTCWPRRSREECAVAVEGDDDECRRRRRLVVVGEEDRGGDGMQGGDGSEVEVCFIALAVRKRIQGNIQGLTSTLILTAVPHPISLVGFSVLCGHAHVQDCKPRPCARKSNITHTQIHHPRATPLPSARIRYNPSPTRAIQD